MCIHTHTRTRTRTHARTHAHSFFRSLPICLRVGCCWMDAIASLVMLTEEWLGWVVGITRIVSRAVYIISRLFKVLFSSRFLALGTKMICFFGWGCCCYCGCCCCCCCQGMVVGLVVVVGTQKETKLNRFWTFFREEQQNAICLVPESYSSVCRLLIERASERGENKSWFFSSSSSSSSSSSLCVYVRKKSSNSSSSSSSGTSSKRAFSIVLTARPFPGRPGTNPCLFVCLFVCLSVCSAVLLIWL